MGILNSELNYDNILKDLGSSCLTKEKCGDCIKEECIIGYAKNCITKCFREDVTFVENGSDNIPVADMKFYNEEDLEQGIAHILKQCKSCKENHYDNCIVNIIRNCYEIGLFGEIQKYEGSNFRYLNQIHNSHPRIAQNVIEEFHKELD